MSSPSENYKDLFHYFGLAAYDGQCFQMELKIIVLLLIRANNRSLSIRLLKQDKSVLDKQTLGTLIRVIRKIVSFDDRAVTAIEVALTNRNRLLHEFYERHATDLLSHTGREKMIRELESYSDSFEIAETVARSVSVAIGKYLGLTDEILQAELERMKKAATENEPGNTERGAPVSDPPPSKPPDRH